MITGSSDTTRERPRLGGPAVKVTSEFLTLPGGATRSEKAPTYDLVPPEGLRRTALRFSFGAETHGAWNWVKSIQSESTAARFAHEAYNHMMEHMIKMMEGDLADDHLGAIGWAQAVLCHIENKYNKPWTELHS